MAKPFLVVQLSDPHIGATWGGGDPMAGLRAVVDAVRRLPDDPDAVLVSGDLADNAADEEYEFVRESLALIGAPVYVVAGNHDDRDALRRHFDVPGPLGAPVQYAADLGSLRLVVLDSTRPGEDPGELDAARLAWLDAELAAAPERAATCIERLQASLQAGRCSRRPARTCRRGSISSPGRSLFPPIPRASPSMRSWTDRSPRTSSP